MATVKIWNINKRILKRIQYICQDKKTENGKYITGINCVSVPEYSAQQMNATKEQYRKTGGVLAYHVVQSFKPGEVTPEQAHEIGAKYAKRLFGDRYEVLVATHTDKSHIHNHIFFNSVSFLTGLKYHDGGTQNLSHLRRESDLLCHDNGLSVVTDPKPGKHMSYNLYQAEQSGQKTVRSLIREDIDEAISRARNIPEFITILRGMDYEVSDKGKYLKVRPFGKERFFRLYKLGKEYSEEEIARRIREKSNPVPKKQQEKRPQFVKRNRQRQSAFLQYARRHAGKSDLLRTYLYYRNLLKRVRDKKYPRRPALYLREDMHKLRRFNDQTLLLYREGIRSPEQLAAFLDRLGGKMKTLNGNRQQLRKALRAAEDEAEMSVLQSEIACIGQEIKTVYREQKLAEEIAARHGLVTEKANRETEKAEKELSQERSVKHEH